MELIQERPLGFKATTIHRLLLPGTRTTGPQPSNHIYILHLTQRLPNNSHKAKSLEKKHSKVHGKILHGPKRPFCSAASAKNENLTFLAMLFTTLFFKRLLDLILAD